VTYQLISRGERFLPGIAGVTLSWPDRELAELLLFDKLLVMERSLLFQSLLLQSLFLI